MGLGGFLGGGGGGGDGFAYGYEDVIVVYCCDEWVVNTVPAAMGEVEGAILMGWRGGGGVGGLDWIVFLEGGG